MKKAQSNKMSMIYATQNACERQIDVVNEFLPFKQAFQEFRECLTEIGVLFRIQDTPTIGITQNKIYLKTEMAKAAIEIANGICFYAEDTKNYQLLEKADFSTSDIIQARDFISAQRCFILQALAEEHLTPLASYGIHTSHLEDFTARITAFESVIIGPREFQAQKKAATRALDVLIKKADHIMKNRMDRMVTRLRSRHPQFYQDYFNARKIINTGLRHTKPAASPSPAA